MPTYTNLMNVRASLFLLWLAVAILPASADVCNGKVCVERVPIIAGVVVGVVVLLSICVCIFAYTRWRRTRQWQRDYKQKAEAQELQAQDTAYGPVYAYQPADAWYPSEPAGASYASQPASGSHDSQPAGTSYQYQPANTSYPTQPADTYQPRTNQMYITS